MSLYPCVFQPWISVNLLILILGMSRARRSRLQILSIVIAKRFGDSRIASNTFSLRSLRSPELSLGWFFEFRKLLLVRFCFDVWALFILFCNLCNTLTGDRNRPWNQQTTIRWDDWGDYDNPNDYMETNVYADLSFLQAITIALIVRIFPPPSHIIFLITLAHFEMPWAIEVIWAIISKLGFRELSFMGKKRPCKRHFLAKSDETSLKVQLYLNTTLPSISFPSIRCLTKSLLWKNK